LRLRSLEAAALFNPLRLPHHLQETWHAGCVEVLRKVPGASRPDYRARGTRLARSLSESGDGFATYRKGGIAMDFRPLNTTERTRLLTALRGNAQENRAILTDRRDTSFSGTAEDVPDEEVITAIRSVPCHY
jgi:hypothetical protein